MTRKEIREETACRLREAGIEEYEYETWMLLEWKLGVDRAEYFMDPDAEVPQEQWNDLDAALRKRERRIPLQYLMGSCEFMGYSFAVDERVLIPRQDTECLVELAVEQMRRSPEPCRVLDLCTGSGCIGVSVKLLCPQAQVVLSDVSEGALAVAGENARRLGAPAELVQGDLFENVQGTFDYILSNPPYIPSKVIDGLMPEVRDHEPGWRWTARRTGCIFTGGLSVRRRNVFVPEAACSLRSGRNRAKRSFRCCRRPDTRRRQSGRIWPGSTESPSAAGRGRRSLSAAGETGGSRYICRAGKKELCDRLPITIKQEVHHV